jgi:hypothetical protein
MTFIAALVAFVESPVGVAAIAAIPNLISTILGDAIKKGAVTAADITAYLSTQEAFDTLVPKRMTV